MSAGAVIKAAYGMMAGTAGEISMTLERQRPASKKDLRIWVTSLRAAANELETLIK